MVTFAVVALAAVSAACAGGPEAPPRPSAFAPPAPPRPAAFDVQQARAGVLTLAGPGGSFDAAPRADARVYRPAPATAADVAVGDWSTVVGVLNEVLNFAVRQVVWPAALGVRPDDDGIPRSADGFAGHEAARDGAGTAAVRRPRGATHGQDAHAHRPGRRHHTRRRGRQPDPARRGRWPAAIRPGDRIAIVPERPGPAWSQAAAFRRAGGARSARRRTRGQPVFRRAAQRRCLGFVRRVHRRIIGA
ncbi:MAG: hypothetical protein U0531_18125 [Dehalococcoidia bacterium]